MLKELISPRTIRGKFFLLTTLLTVIPMLVLSMAFYYIAADKLIDNSKAQAFSSLQMGQNYMDTVIADLEDLTNVIMGNTQIQEILNQATDDDYEYLQNVDKVNKIMMSIIQAKSYISSYLIYNRLGKPGKQFYKSSDSSGLILSTSLSPEYTPYWYHMLIENGPVIWINQSFDRQDGSETIFNSLIVGKLLKRTEDDYKNLGFVMLEINRSKFFEVLQFLVQDGKSQAFVLDENRNVLFHLPENQPADARMIDAFLALPDSAQDSGTGEIEWNGTKYIVSFVTNPKYGWKTVHLIEADHLFQDAKIIRKLTIYMFLIMLLAGWLLAHRLGNTIIRPLHQLRKLMTVNNSLELLHRYRFDPRDEVGQIGYRFIRMEEEKRQLNQQVYDALVKRKEAEIHALQAQINPHFLYNTLESLNWLAISRNQIDISEVVGSLGKFFRLTINRGNDFIRVSEEIEHVTSYVNVQKFRYKDKLDFIVEVDPGIRSYYVPKFILQPIVENAIYHGIKLKEGKGTIMLTGEISDNRIVFRITDDGLGIEPDRLEEIAQSLQDGSPGKIYGLKNVHDRLRLRFGEGYGITIQSKSGEYTTVALTVPFITSPEEDLNR